MLLKTNSNYCILKTHSVTNAVFIFLKIKMMQKVPGNRCVSRGGSVGSMKPFMLLSQQFTNKSLVLPAV